MADLVELTEEQMKEVAGGAVAGPAYTNGYTIPGGSGWYYPNYQINAGTRSPGWYYRGY